MDDEAPQAAASEVRLRASFTMTPLYVYDLGASARAAWHALQTFALGSGECWPSIPTLAERAGVSEATIHRGLRTLRAAGAVEVSARITPFGASRSNLYVLRMDPPDKSACQGVTSDRGEGVTSDRGRVSAVTPPIGSRRRGSRRTEPEGSVASASKALRDELWQALGRVVQWGGPDGGPERGDRAGETRFGRAVRAFSDVGATPDEVERRAERYRRLMPTVALTPEAFVKWWSALGEDPGAREARAILEAGERRGRSSVA
jgi:Helix-turn-helix domain